jgi:predicted ATPase
LIEGVQHLNLRSEEMRRPSPPLKRTGFLPDGSNLPHVIARLKGDKPGYRSWIEHIRTALPIEDIKVITKPEDKSRYLVARYKTGVSVPSWHLSDGTLRLLALTALAYQPDNTGVYFIEEPENGIHPQAVETVFQSLSSVYDGQVLVATHSPVLVAQIEPRQLLCFSKTASGETDVITGDQHPRLKGWKAEVSLG